MTEVPITKSAALKLIKKLESLGLGFPRTQEGIEAFAGMFMSITGTLERAEWLVGRILIGCPRCPTPIEMRRIFDLKYPPADGISVNAADLSGVMEMSKGKAE
jgi:hypothetical protein